MSAKHYTRNLLVTHDRSLLSRNSSLGEGAAVKESEWHLNGEIYRRYKRNGQNELGTLKKSQENVCGWACLGIGD